MNTFIKTMTLAITLIFASSLVSAQDDYYKIEGFGGYAYMNLDRGLDLDDFSEFGKNRVNSHGFNGSVTYNFTRKWGAKFDISLHTFGEDFTSNVAVNPPIIGGSFKSSQSDYQYMGGIQYKNNSKEAPRFKPFAHVLAGIAHQKFTLEETSPTPSQLIDLNSNDFAMKFGGGVDFKLVKNLDVRLFQFDYNPIWRGEKDLGPQLGTLKGAVRNNYM
ncbi:MAG TPA: outer membrane beta-barrel protein, partial [Pyrinomonadaceae bacterium]